MLSGPSGSTKGINPYDQWLTNRGYAVLSVNFRASTGFGKKFTNAGDLEWGRKAHDDLIDTVDWVIKEKKIHVAYVLFPDEGHGFARPENNKAFNAVTEAFLSKHLGGRYEPVGEDFKGSSISVPKGAEQVPGLAEALPKGKGA